MDHQNINCIRFSLQQMKRKHDSPNKGTNELVSDQEVFLI